MSKGDEVQFAVTTGKLKKSFKTPYKSEVDASSTKKVIYDAIHFKIVFYKQRWNIDSSSNIKRKWIADKTEKSVVDRKGRLWRPKYTFGIYFVLLSSLRLFGWCLTPHRRYFSHIVAILARKLCLYAKRIQYSWTDTN